MNQGALNTYLQDREETLSEAILIDMARQAAAGMKYLGNTPEKPCLYTFQRQIMWSIEI
jgi:hypothetical protein